MAGSNFEIDKTPEHIKRKVFLTFSRGMEMEHWAKMGNRAVEQLYVYDCNSYFMILIITAVYVQKTQ